MISAARIVGVATLNFTVGTAGSVVGGGVTLENLGVVHAAERVETSKHHRSGQFPNWSFVRRMTLTLSGKIVGADAADYIVHRKELMAAALPNEGTQTTREHGTLYVTYTGQSEVFATFVLEQIDAPLTVDESSKSAPYTLVLTNDTGYWHLTSGGAVLKV